MKKNYLLFILLGFLSCKEQTEENTIRQNDSPAKAETIRKDEVHIQLSDTSQTFSTNLRLDEFQDRPVFVEMGKGAGQPSITVQTKNKIKLLGGSPHASFHYELEIDRGDSVTIELEKVRLDAHNEIRIPIFRISNSDRKWDELNFQGLHYKKNLSNRAIEIDTTRSYLFTAWNSEKMYENALSLLDSLKSEDKISREFYLSEKENQKYEFAARKLREGKFQEQEFGYAIGIGDQKILPESEDQLENASYISYIRQLIDTKYFRGTKRESNSKKFDFVLNEPDLLDDQLKVAVLDSYLKSVYFLEKHKFPAYLEKFNQVSLNPELERKWSNVLANLEQNRLKLNTSNRNVGILLDLVNDNELTFEQILENQKGKVVLVDFWASWCAPCLQEMPYMKKVKSLFEEEKFQVIEISIDEDYAAWERASKSLGVSEAEESYIMANWKESNLYKTYSVTFIPRYLLFDQDGKIINDDAPRPSSPELEELIDASIHRPGMTTRL